MSSDKINLTLVDPASSAQTVSRMAFKQGGQKQFANKLHQALAQRQWEVKVRNNIYLKYNKNERPKWTIPG